MTRTRTRHGYVYEVHTQTRDTNMTRTRITDTDPINPRFSFNNNVYYLSYNYSLIQTTYGS